MAKQYDIALWDIQFYKVDEEGNELQNPDGTVKLFQLKRDIDCSFIAEGTTEDELEEINNESI
tara:strand:+ start:583 stop:771 length:189 start_codon:yes stop_codon:yes gene_type:complete